MAGSPEEILVAESDHWVVAMHKWESGFRLKYRAGLSGEIDDVVHCIAESELEELRDLLSRIPKNSTVVGGT